MYDADKGIRAGCYHDDMVALEREALIVRSRRNGWSQSIARRFGLTQQGVSKALQRSAEGGPGRDPRD